MPTAWRGHGGQKSCPRQAVGMAPPSLLTERGSLILHQESHAMSETDNKFVVKRAETLAREFLTRRPEVVIHPFEDSDLDFVATLSPSANLKIEGFSPFGVIVWGTDRSVSSEMAASSFATRRWKSEDERSKGDRT